MRNQGIKTSRRGASISINGRRTLVGRKEEMTSQRLDTGAVDLGILSDEEPLRSGRSRSIGVDDMARCVEARTLVVGYDLQTTRLVDSRWILRLC